MAKRAQTSRSVVVQVPKEGGRRGPCWPIEKNQERVVGSLKAVQGLGGWGIGPVMLFRKQGVWGIRNIMV